MKDLITAKGSPTKGFFINMLTRDIDINDAILDLLDNCLDGVVRMRKAEGIEKHSAGFYSGFEAKIVITPNSFCIEDNCGGIPLDTAKQYAFRMGRDETSPIDDAATVGIYGIGMKRAIFKIGKSASVHSVTKEDDFTVTIPREWEMQTDNWDFDIEINKKEENTICGTEVIISDINPVLQKQWANEGHLNEFVLELMGHIRESYSLIIERGFTVSVNGQKVEPNEVSFIISNEGNGIKPFIYKNKIGNVNVRLVVGFYAPPPSINESDKMAEKAVQRTSKDAGWTVICNDRVVLYNNKDHLTGWGENTVPRYHTQFVGIRGIVEFESSRPEELPMTTTKRGVDLASPVYAEVKKKMCEGLKLFTNFTNNWKGTASIETSYFSSSERLKLDDLVSPDTEEDEQKNKRFKMVPTRDGGKQYKPTLPKKKNSSDIVYIRFASQRSDCKKVGEYLFEDDIEREPSVVGEACFKEALKAANKAGGEE